MCPAHGGFINCLFFSFQQSETLRCSMYHRVASVSEKQHSLRFMFVWLTQLTDDQSRYRLISAQWYAAAHLLAVNGSLCLGEKQNDIVCENPAFRQVQVKLHCCINVVSVCVFAEWQLNESDTELIDTDVSTCEHTTGTERQLVSWCFFCVPVCRVVTNWITVCPGR